MNTPDPCPFLMRGFVGIKQIQASGADTPYTVNELAEVVAGAMGAGAMGVPANVMLLPARSQVQHAFSSHEKARRFFGQATPTALAEGVARMAAWAQRAGARRSGVFGEIEIPRNLPPGWRQR
jgi:UDP-glucose 4-epimerase